MKYVATILSFLMLFACSSVPEKARYYLLASDLKTSDPFKIAAPPMADKAHVTLTKVMMASYLNQSNLALMKSESEVVYANKHLWAEPLSSGFKKALVYEFNRLSAQRMLSANEPAAQQSSLQLELRVDQFLPTENGHVLLSGQYWVLSHSQLIATKRFELSSPLVRDGYAHAVSVQRALVRDLAKQLVNVTLIP